LDELATGVVGQDEFAGVEVDIAAEAAVKPDGQFSRHLQGIKPFAVADAMRRIMSRLIARTPQQMLKSANLANQFNKPR
jgi:hypothetical protein